MGEWTIKASVAGERFLWSCASALLVESSAAAVHVDHMRDDPARMVTCPFVSLTYFIWITLVLAEPMSNIDLSRGRQLVAALGNAASYNDKGSQWCGHSPARVEEMQQGFHRDQLALARRIGLERLGDELRSAIENGAAGRDGTGRYVQLAARLFGISDAGAEIP
jgi:hypothetical protein